MKENTYKQIQKTPLIQLKSGGFVHSIPRAHDHITYHTNFVSLCSQENVVLLLVHHCNPCDCTISLAIDTVLNSGIMPAQYVENKVYHIGNKKGHMIRNKGCRNIAKTQAGKPTWCCGLSSCAPSKRGPSLDSIIWLCHYLLLTGGKCFMWSCLCFWRHPKSSKALQFVSHISHIGIVFLISKFILIVAVRAIILVLNLTINLFFCGLLFLLASPSQWFKVEHAWRMCNYTSTEYGTQQISISTNRYPLPHLGGPVWVDNDSDPVAPVLGEEVADCCDHIFISCHSDDSTCRKVDPHDHCMVIGTFYFRTVQEHLLDPWTHSWKNCGFCICSLTTKYVQVGLHVLSNLSPSPFVQVLAAAVRFQEVKLVDTR